MSEAPASSVDSSQPRVHLIHYPHQVHGENVFFAKRQVSELKNPPALTRLASPASKLANTLPLPAASALSGSSARVSSGVATASTAGSVVLSAKKWFTATPARFLSLRNPADCSQ